MTGLESNCSKKHGVDDDFKKNDPLFTAPDSGSIYVNGIDGVRHPDAARESIAVVFEEADNSYSYLTVLENLLYFGLLNKWSRAEAKRRAERMMAVLNLTPYAERLTQTLSRG